MSTTCRIENCIRRDGHEGQHQDPSGHDFIAAAMIDAPALLERAIEVMRARGREYRGGDAQERERHMTDIVAIFNRLRPGATPLSELDGWMFMVALKLVRAAAGGSLDTFVDGAAYFALSGEASQRGKNP